MTPLADYVATTDAPSLPGATAFLAASGVNDVVLTSFAIVSSQPRESRFQVSFQKTITNVSRTLRLGDDAAKEGISSSRSIPINLQTTLSGNLEFGMDQSKPSLDDAFFIKINSLTASASASVPPTSLVNLELLGRFLRTEVTSGSLSLGATVTVSTPSDVSLKQLIAAPIGSLVTVSAPSATVSGGFGVRTTLFQGTPAQVQHTGSITFADSDIFDGTPIEVSVTGFSSGLQNLFTINSTTFREALSQLGNGFDSLRSTNLFDTTLGLSQGLDIGNALQFKQLWDAAVTNLFSGTSPVGDLQSLLSRLGVTGGSFNSTSQQLTFPIDLSRSLLKQTARSILALTLVQSARSTRLAWRMFKPRPTWISRWAST